MAIAAPSMAATTIGCAQVGTTAPYQFVITYAYDGTGSFPRAFALDVTTSLGTISGVTATKLDGESTSASKGFGIFPGTIAIDTAGVVTSYGSPIAPNGDPGSITGNPITNAVTLELGSLYTTGGQPDASGTLVTVALSGVSAGQTATVTIVPNTTRGGVVLEDATSIGAFTSTCAVGIPPAGCACKGNVNGDASVSSLDIVALVGNLNTYGGKTKTIGSTHAAFSLCGDANVDGSNSSLDVVKIVGWLNTYGGKTKTIVCPHTYN